MTKIEVQAGHMTHLLDDILTIGKSEAGKIKVVPVNLNLKTFVESILEEIRTTAKGMREIVFTFSCATAKVNMDDKLLRNVISNLLTNAIKYSAPDAKVSLSLSDLNKDILIEVTDSGIGIPEHELKGIFEPFQRGSNASHVQGTGLSLSIVKKAVELMKGSVQVESALYHGTVFKVRIPR